MYTLQIAYKDSYNISYLYKLYIIQVFVNFKIDSEQVLEELDVYLITFHLILLKVNVDKTTVNHNSILIEFAENNEKFVA